jgi:hypothetical protein
LQVDLGLEILRPFLALLQNRVEYVPLQLDVYSPTPSQSDD